MVQPQPPFQVEPLRILIYGVTVQRPKRLLTCQQELIQ